MYNFELVEKGHLGGWVRYHGKMLKLGKNSIKLSADAAKHFGEPEQTEGGDNRLPLAIYVDNVQQVVKLVRDPNGYAFFARGRFQTYGVNTSNYMRQQIVTMPLGDYVMSDEEPGIFKLAR